MTDYVDRLKAALADRYAIEREVGSGGMATVYLAEDLKHERTVAVKVLRQELAVTLGSERFLQETRVTANLNHPHILPLHDSGEARGFLYYVMPYIEGETLRERMNREGQLPLDDALQITKEVAAALSYAHSHDVIHRDIKPENILLSAGEAVVADFGIARAITEAGGEHLTDTGISIGTPAYMSPEQASGERKLDGRSDIYSLGCVLYEMLAGEPPYTGPTAQAVMAKKLSEPTPKVSVVRETVPGTIEQAVDRALAKVPADRYATAEQFSSALKGTQATAHRASARRRTLVLGVPVAAGVFVAAVVSLRLLGAGTTSITTSNLRAVTSEPGMEWQPALSPDGSQVVYMRGPFRVGQILIRSTRDIAGGAFTPAPDMFAQLFPTWSPDGEYIRFYGCDEGGCSHREVGRLGGSIREYEVPLQTVFQYSWSPDGSRAVYAVLDSIYIYSAVDDTAFLAAVAERPASVHSFSWSPNGMRIVYVLDNGHWVLTFNVASSSIWVVPAGGGESVRVTDDEFMDVSPVWLDDEHLLFVSNRDGPREVYAVAVGPAGPSGELLKVPGPTDPHSICYSVTGKKLAYSRLSVRQNIWAYELAQQRPVSGEDGEQVTFGNQTIELHHVSPDGAWIAYDGNVGGTMDIYKQRLAGGDPVRLTSGPIDEFAPRWSPDGTEIAFYSSDGSEETSVLVMSADGGGAVELESVPPYSLFPSWSPSGLEIAVAGAPGPSRRGDVWMVTRDSVGGSWGEASRLTESGCSGTEWAPDGSGVLCAVLGPDEDPMVEVEFVLVARDGQVLWRRNPAPTIAMPPFFPRFSWGGERVFFVGYLDGSTGIVSIPVQAGEPRLEVVWDEPSATDAMWFSVGPERLFVSIGERESDIWAMDVEF